MIVVVVVIVALVVVVGLIAWFVLRGPRQDPGIVGFRRHIDALSPESRREVQDRVRDQQVERPDPDEDRG